MRNLHLGVDPGLNIPVQAKSFTLIKVSIFQCIHCFKQTLHNPQAVIANAWFIKEMFLHSCARSDEGYGIVVKMSMFARKSVYVGIWILQWM